MQARFVDVLPPPNWDDERNKKREVAAKAKAIILTVFLIGGCMGFAVGIAAGVRLAEREPLAVEEQLEDKQKYNAKYSFSEKGENGERTDSDEMVRGEGTAK